MRIRYRVPGIASEQKNANWRTTAHRQAKCLVKKVEWLRGGESNRQEGGEIVRTSVVVVSAVAAAVGLVMATSAIAGEAAKIVKYDVVDDTSIPKSLTGKPGDAKNGRKISIHRKKGNCLACHKMPVPEQQFHGNIAPDLKGVAERYTEGELRLRIVDSKVLNEDSFMPAFYRNDGFHRVLKKFVGKTLLSAQEVEDVVAYLLTLK